MKKSFKKNNKVQPRKRVNKSKNKLTEISKEEVANEGVILNDIMDEEDKEVEIILNDLVPERDKEKYGMKMNSINKVKKGGMKLNLNLFPKPKKSTKSTKKSKNNKVIRNEQITDIKDDEVLEDINNSEE